MSKKTSEVLDGVWRATMRPPDDREIYQWIAEEGELPNCYAVPGPFDYSLVPFIKEPLEALRNPRKREVVAMSAIQCLKTFVGEAWLLWLIENDPGPTQWLQPTDEQAKEHCEERFLRLVESYPRINRFFTENRHDKKTAVILFQHMWMRMEGCGLGNLQRKSVKNQMCSEVWQRDKWLPGLLREAEARLLQYRFGSYNSKRYIESQPGEVIRDQEGKIIGDDILVSFNKWSRKEWGFRCQGCDKLQPWLFNYMREDGTRAAIRWDKNSRTRRENGEWRWGELIQTIRYECIYCGHAHADQSLTRTRMMTQGCGYIIGDPDAPPEGDSFSWNQIAMPAIPWFGHVKEFLFAIDQARKGFDQPLRQLYTKNFAKPFDPEKHGHFTRLPVIEVQVDRTSPKVSIEYDGTIFDIPLMGVDVQQSSFFALVQMWNKNGDILTVWAGELYTWQEVREKQEEFKVADQDVMIDSQHRSIEVFQNCVRNHHWENPGDGSKVFLCWKALRGADRDWFYYRGKKDKRALVYTWPPDRGDPVSGLRSDDPIRKELAGMACPLITWARPTVMDVAMARRDGKGSAKLLTMKAEWNEMLNRQWHSQKKILKQNSFGQTKWRYEKFRDDHLLDCWLMIIVRAFMRRILGEPEAEEAAQARQE